MRAPTASKSSTAVLHVGLTDWLPYLLVRIRGKINVKLPTYTP